MALHDPLMEAQRLAALHGLALGTDAEQDFDALVALAAGLLDCPTALLTMVDRDRVWVKAQHGGEPIDAAPRDLAFCDHTIRQADGMVVADLTRDTRFADNPMVQGPDGLRFYAGLPIHAAGEDGVSHPVGSLCVIDYLPRQLDEAGAAALRHLTAVAESLIAARAAATRAGEVAALVTAQAAVLRRQDYTFQQAERMAMMGSWRFQLGSETLSWSDGVFRIYGLPRGESLALSAAMDFYPPAEQARIAAALATCMETGEPFDLELDFVDAAGCTRRVRSLGEREYEDGKPVSLIGVFQDVTERHALEQRLRRSAEQDPLTGLANRAAFDRAMSRAIAKARAESTPLLLLMIDLDGFKAINDTLGHLAGDEVLCSVARRLAEPWLRGSLAARLGGDEFALVVTDPVLAADVPALVARLEQALCQPVRGKDGLVIAAAGSVGQAVLDPGMASIRDIVHAADADLYIAKRRRIGDRRRRAA